MLGVGLNQVRPRWWWGGEVYTELCGQWPLQPWNSPWLRRPGGAGADPPRAWAGLQDGHTAPSTLRRAAKFSQAGEAVLRQSTWQHSLVSLQGLAGAQAGHPAFGLIRLVWRHPSAGVLGWALGQALRLWGASFLETSRHGRYLLCNLRQGTQFPCL